MAPKRKAPKNDESDESAEEREPQPAPVARSARTKRVTIPSAKPVALPSRPDASEEEQIAREGSDEDGLEFLDDEDYQNSASEDSAGRQGRRRSDSGGSDEGKDESREHDRFLPIANVARIIKSVLPDHAKVAKDARDAIQECAGEFVSFIASEGGIKVDELCSW
jgi:hypothetical protein